MTGFSILIAVYNAAPFLEACLQSLQSQTMEGWEAICIDDCSTDGSRDILQRYADNDARFTVLQTPVNSGQAVARNLGLSRAAGEFTLMLDADDYLAPDALECLWEAHEAHAEVDAMLFNLTKVWEDGREIAWTWPDGRRLLTGKEAGLLSIDWRIHGCFALRTELHREYPYDTTFRVYSDDTTSRIQLFKSRQVALCEGTYYYRQHESSATHRFSLRRLDFVDANRLLSRKLEKLSVGPEGLSRCEDMAWKIFVGVYREFYVQRRNLSAAEREQMDRRLEQAWKAMHPERISGALKRIPAYFFLPTYKGFTCWQALLLGVKRLLKGGRPG